MRISYIISFKILGPFRTRISFNKSFRILQHHSDFYRSEHIENVSFWRTLASNGILNNVFRIAVKNTIQNSTQKWISFGILEYHLDIFRVSSFRTVLGYNLNGVSRVIQNMRISYGISFRILATFRIRISFKKSFRILEHHSEFYCTIWMECQVSLRMALASTARSTDWVFRKPKFHVVQVSAVSAFRAYCW